METKTALNIAKILVEDDLVEEADAETIEFYNNNTRRFIRPMVSTTTLITNIRLDATFSLSDIVTKEQIDNPKIITDDGRVLDKLNPRLDINFDNSDAIFDLDESLDNLVSKTSVKKKSIPIRIKNTKTRTRYK